MTSFLLLKNGRWAVRPGTYIYDLFAPDHNLQEVEEASSALRGLRVPA